MTGFASLGSGSRGNGTLVEIGGELILVDCGFTLKQAERRLQRLDVRPGDLSAILVTHEHSDHSSGVPALAHKYAWHEDIARYWIEELVGIPCQVEIASEFRYRTPLVGPARSCGPHRSCSPRPPRPRLHRLIRGERAGTRRSCRLRTGTARPGSRRRLRGPRDRDRRDAASSEPRC